MAKKGKVDMVEPSKRSTKSGRKSTTKTKQQELEILQQSINNCVKAGINMGLDYQYDTGTKTLILVIGDDVDYQDGDLIYTGK